MKKKIDAARLFCKRMLELKELTDGNNHTSR